MKKINHVSFLRKTVRLLSLSQLLLQIYFHLYDVFKGRTKTLTFKSQKVAVYINNYEKIRMVHAAFRPGPRDESRVLGSLLEVLRQGDTVYDIDAGYGLHTLFLAKYVGETGRVVAVEPESQNHCQLLKNIEINHLRNVILIRLAFGDRFETKMLDKTRTAGSGGFTLIETHKREKGEDVAVVLGDAIAQERNLPLPRAIKIDVEGYEYQVLQGLKSILSKASCVMICCELHLSHYPKKSNESCILDLLNSMGFPRIETYKRGSEIHALCWKSPGNISRGKISLRREYFLGEAS